LGEAQRRLWLHNYNHWSVKMSDLMKRLERLAALGDHEALLELRRERRRRNLGDDSSEWVKRFGGRQPKLPSFVDPTTLPTVRFLDGTPLSDAGMQWLIGKLIKKDPEADALRQCLSDEGCVQLGDAIRGAWERANPGQTKDWIFHSYGGYADDAARAALLARLGSMTPAGNKNAIQVLAQTPSPEVIGKLIDVAWGGTPAVKRTAREELTRIAQDNQLSLDDLFDAYIPQADSAWQQVAAREAERLEDAMIAEREWSVDLFRRLFIEHPQVRRWTPSLVFSARRGGEDAQLFSLASVDEPVPYAQDAMISLVHPITLDQEQRARWSAALAQRPAPPFLQMHRPCFPKDKEASLDSFALKDVKLKHDAVIEGLKAARFAWAHRDDAWRGFTRELGETALTLTIMPGLGGDNSGDDQEIWGIELGGRVEALRKLSAILYSEVIFALTTFCRIAQGEPMATS
jgi:hypothetical protein